MEQSLPSIDFRYKFNQSQEQPSFGSEEYSFHDKNDNLIEYQESEELREPKIVAAKSR